jgi:hypothetical protein
MATDVVITVVFPNYLVRVDTPRIEIDLPDLPFGYIPGFPHHFQVPRVTERIPHLGHAGAAFFDGHSGTTKYYEYGRYDAAAMGIVRKVAMPDLHIEGESPLSQACFDSSTISLRSGQGGTISGAYIELHQGAYSRMVSYCQRRIQENNNPGRAPYSLLTHSCCHFMKDVAVAGGASMPPVAPPQPAGYILVVRTLNPTLDYTPQAGLIVPCLQTQPDAGAANAQ